MLATTACGYAPVRSTPAQGLRVAAVSNRTAYAEAGGIFAAELRRELAGRGRLESEGSGAPELFVELIALQSSPSGVASEGGAAFGGAASYRLDAALRVRAPGFDDTVAGGEDYLAAVDVLGTEANRRAALRRLAKTLAATAIERYEVSERFRR